MGACDYVFTLCSVNKIANSVVVNPVFMSKLLVCMI